MIGAILGDMIGAPYEFDRGRKTKKFPIFGRSSQFTDDTVMTIAVAERSGKNLAENAGSGDWQDGKRFGAGASEDEIRSWIEELQ